MDIWSELSSAVCVTEEVTDYGEDGTKSLYRDVPSRADDLLAVIR